jgi:hypothetical protein
MKSRKLTFGYKGIALVGAALFLLTACKPVPPLEQLASLNEKASALTTQPGWIYIRSETVYDTDTENNGVLPNGMEIPLAQVSEEWYHINEAGLVDQSVSAMYNVDGETVQIDVVNNGVSWNSATDETTDWSPYAFGDTSGGLADLAQSALEETGQTLEMVTEKVNGRNVSTFTLPYTLTPPLKFPDYDQTATEITTIVSLDNKTGLAVAYTQVMTLEDGSQRTFYHTDVEFQADATPPDEILALLEAHK